MSLTGGLQGNPICRLHQAWERLKKNFAFALPQCKWPLDARWLGNLPGLPPQVELGALGPTTWKKGNAWLVAHSFPLLSFVAPLESASLSSVPFLFLGVELSLILYVIFKGSFVAFSTIFSNTTPPRISLPGFVLKLSIMWFTIEVSSG